LTLEGGHPDTARDMLDRLLSGKPRKLASVDNAFRAQRMGMATSFDDFLRWAPRRPIGYAEEDEDNLDANDAPVLDSDSIDILNRATPLEKLAEAARSPRLPDWIAADVALIGLTRAIVLGNDSVALSLIPIVAKAHPGWAGDLKAFAAANGEQRRFAADLLIERHSEFRTDLSPEFHVSPPNVGIEFYAWWCAEDPGKKPAAVPDAVLSAEEQTRAGDESRRLRDAGPAQAFIAPSVIAWARSHPADARVPEALHDIVRITRYGCRGIPEINGPISQAAFDLLHQNYPASEWAKRTPYWFKD